MKANHENFKQQLAELNKNENITLKEYRDKKEALQKEQKSKMQSLLTAEQKSKLEQIKKEKEAKHEMMAAKKLDRMKADLNLSDAQVEKLKATKVSTHNKIKAIKKNEQLSRAEKKEQLMALKEANKENFKKR